MSVSPGSMSLSDKCRLVPSHFACAVQVSRDRLSCIRLRTAAPPQYLTLVQNWEHVLSSQMMEGGLDRLRQHMVIPQSGKRAWHVSAMEGAGGDGCPSLQGFTL